ncbi:DUF998 domain-containing protein [Pseudogracilibacillus sp. SO30301A]|uniref:DUF998 domain-containing protein n=1 Tax=Pseudogracilibacillus sp. SO30301A TaxID=3098291 RepID=UPI00300E11B4
MKKTLINYLGLLSVVSLISYTMAVLFAPLAYPDYNWQAQAVSDLSASDAPSLTLWNQLASLYGICGVVSITLVCVYMQGKLNRKLRIGIYLFALMLWISNVGYTMFPLSSSGNAGTMQDIIHIYVITVVVVLLSIISLLFIIVGGIKTSNYKRLSMFALLSLLLMFIGALGTGLAPAEYFGIPERFSVFSVTIFNAILGVYLYLGFE